MHTYSSQVIQHIDSLLGELIENEMMSKSVFDLEAIIDELNETKKQYRLSGMAEHILIVATAEYEFRMSRLNKVGIGVTK